MVNEPHAVKVTSNDAELELPFSSPRRTPAVNGGLVGTAAQAALYASAVGVEISKEMLFPSGSVTAYREERVRAPSGSAFPRVIVPFGSNAAASRHEPVHS